MKKYVEKTQLAKQRIINGKRNMVVSKLPQLKKLKQLEEENKRLKAMYADVSVDKKILQDALEGKL